MKNIVRISLLPAAFLLLALGSPASAAEEASVLAIKYNATDQKNEIYRQNLATGEATLLQQFSFPGNGWSVGNSFTDPTTGHLYMQSVTGDFLVYNAKDNSISVLKGPTDNQALFPLLLPGGTNALISYGENGEVHIGENSLVTLEEGGRQKLFATDAAGSAIDIDVTDGSDLLVNGVSVMGSINTEIQERQLAISNERSQRLAAEAALGSRISAEESARLAADNALSARIDKLDDRISSSTATAIAMGGMTFLPDTKFNLAANVGTYSGAHAVSVQAGYVISRHVGVSGGVAGGVNRGGKVGGRVGMVFGW